MIGFDTNPENLKKLIPAGLLKSFDELESRIAGQANDAKDVNAMKRIAVFDMDNTLLVGDIGDALFAQLKIDERDKQVALSIEKTPISLTWDELIQILHKQGKKIAYPLMTTAMAGIPVEIVKEATRRAMDPSRTVLEIENMRIPVPYPQPAMQAFTFYLKSLGYTIYIISATNEISVKWVAQEYFGVPEECVFAMKPALYRHGGYGEIIGGTISGPITVEQGKTEAYRKLLGSHSASINAGDSLTDIPVLNLTHPKGLIIWVENKNNIQQRVSVIQSISNPGNLFFLSQD